MSPLSNYDAKDVLQEQYLAEYQKGMRFFYLQLVDLNATIYILEQISKFPFGLFCVSDQTIFFQLIVRNFFDAGLLTITRLATDRGPDLYTLVRFKNRVQRMIKPEFVGLFQGKLKESRFNSSTAKLFERARKLRDERIGHIKEDIVMETTEGVNLDFSELKSLRDALNLLLDTLSFNVDHIMLPLPYDPRVLHPIGNNPKSDIEELLDFIAGQSLILNAPEKHPASWKRQRIRLTDNQLEQINYYRKKLGLTEV